MGRRTVWLWSFVLSCFVLGAGSYDVHAQNAVLGPFEQPADTLSFKNIPATPEPLYDTIAGPLPDTVKAHGRPYLVVGDIEVSVNKSVYIEAGTVFLFKNFTGVRIAGKLEAKGQKERPIIFTSENDRSVNSAATLFPNPYDWNGISIQKTGAGTIFSYCKIFYSVYGMESETKFIRLDPVLLRYNGKSNLVIEGKIHATTDQPYSYVMTMKEAISSGFSPELFKDPLAAKREIVRLSSYTVLLASLAGGIDAVLHYQRSSNDFNSLTAPNSSATPSQISDVRDSRNGYRNLAILYFSMLAVSGAGFAWTFTF